MSGFDTRVARELTDGHTEWSFARCHEACDEIDRLRVTLTATEAVIQAAGVVDVLSATEIICENDVWNACEVLHDALAALAAARVVVSADPPGED